jgi:hypothetical protein
LSIGCIKKYKVDIAIQKAQISNIHPAERQKKIFMHNLSNHNQLKILIFEKEPKLKRIRKVKGNT